MVCANCGDGMKGKCAVCKTMWILIVIGGINWGLVGLGILLGTNLNLVDLIFGRWITLEAIIYVLVGLATLGKLFGKCKCSHGMNSSAPMGGGSMPMNGGMGMK